MDREYRGSMKRSGCRYALVKEYDLADIEPLVAFPHKPENTRPISQVGHVPIDQAVIGSCTNGRMEDLRIRRQDPRKGAESIRRCALSSSPEPRQFTLRPWKRG